MNLDQLVITIRLSCGDQFCKTCFMEIYFDSDIPTCRARGRHKAELRLPSADVIGLQTIPAQILGASAAKRPTIASRSYRVHVRQLGAAAAAACDIHVLELVIGVWRGKGDETLDYVC